MNAGDLTIQSVKARAVDAPISRPVKTAFGAIRSAPLVLIDVLTDQGITSTTIKFCTVRLSTPICPGIRLFLKTRPGVLRWPTAPMCR